MDRWQKQLGGPVFVDDGPVDFEAFEEATHRIVFVLKEGRHKKRNRRAGRLFVSPLATANPGQCSKLKLPLLPDRIVNLIKHGHHPGDGYPSRSEADSAVCLALVRAGLDFDAIRDVFDTQPIGERYWERGVDYLRRTVQAAESYVRPGCARVEISTTNVYAEDLYEHDGVPGGTRVKLVGIVETHGDLHGRKVQSRFWQPRAGRAHERLRWEAVWRAAGFAKPPRNATPFLLEGQRMEVEVPVTITTLEVSAFIPLRTSEP